MDFFFFFHPKNQFMGAAKIDKVISAWLLNIAKDLK